MLPIEKICDLLKSKLGLNEEEVNKIIETNIYLKKVIEKDVSEVISVFENFGLTDNEIAEIAKKNPWMLTESFERIKYLKKYYEMIDLTDYRELLIKQPIAMSVNPIEVKEEIEKLQASGKTNDEIRNILINDLTSYVSL